MEQSASLIVMTFDDFHSHTNVQGIPIAALRTYFEAGRLSGCMERLHYFRKRFEDRGLVPWSKEVNYPPDNFQQERNCVPDRAVTSEPSRVQPCARHAGARPLAETKIIPAQFVQHGRLEPESYPAKNPSKGPPKIKKWMVR